MKTVLVTGFDPFGGDVINPALESVKQLKEIRTDEYQVEVREIPTVFDKARYHLIEAIEETKPDFVICVGQSGGNRTGIAVERVAINVNDAILPDNEGNQPIDTPVVDGGPVAYWSTLPIKAMVRTMTQDGVLASVSQTAGTFVCNHIFYGLMHHIAQSGGSIRGGFIHIPPLPEQIAKYPGIQNMELETIVKGLKLAIEAAVTYDEDIVAVGGQIS